MVVAECSTKFLFKELCGLMSPSSIYGYAHYSIAPCTLTNPFLTKEQNQ